MSKTGTTTTTTTTTTTHTKYVIPMQELVPEGEYTDVFETFTKDKPGLSAFYNADALKLKVQSAKAMGDALMKDGCSREYAVPLSLLTLYDIIMLVDDSSSMNYAEGGDRKKTLKKTLEQITKIYDQANGTGILSVRFINNTKGRKNVTHAKVDSLLDDRKYEGGTMIGTALEKRVIQPFVLTKKMVKPLLVMTITDGIVEGERTGLLKHVIKNCIEKLKSDPEKGIDAVAFHFCRIGNDEGAMKMLEHLDDCEEVGEYVDCLSVDEPLEALSDDSLKWRILVKLLLGAMVPKVDAMELELDLGKDVDEVDLDKTTKKPTEEYEDED